MRLEIFVLIAVCIFVFFILELVRRRQLREKYSVLWLGVGMLAIVLVLGRPWLDRVSSLIGIAYAPSTLFLFWNLFLTAVVAHLSWETSRLEDKSRRLAEELAIKGAQKQGDGSDHETSAKV